MKRGTLRCVIVTLLLGLMGVGCQEEKEEIPVGEETIDEPIQEFSGTTLDFYNKGRLNWRLKADHMTKPLSDSGSITVIPVDLILFDSVGEVRSKVLADSGIITNTMNYYNVWGNVYIRTRDSMVVRTQRLKWFKERQKVESDTFVQIQTKNGDVLRGKGLDATEDFSRFSFKSQVTGTFPDFDKRVENNNDNIF